MMSFCIRISSNSRYVPTFILSAQGCTPRKISNRQLLKHVKQIRMSTFLNDFLRSNLPVTLSMGAVRDKLAHITRQLSSNTCRKTDSIPINNIDIEKNIYRENNIIHHNLNNKNSELIFESINRINYIDISRDQLVDINNSKRSENEIPIINLERNWVSSSLMTNGSNVGSFTKDKTKVKFSTVSKTATALKEKDIDTPITKPSSDNQQHKDNLEFVYNTLSDDLPRFFVKTMNYNIYHKELEFVNNIKGSTTNGLVHYMKQMALLRMFGHIKYTHVKLEVLKITMHTQDNTVRVRWRINGVSGMKFLFTFWRVNPWKMRDNISTNEAWYDGFSTFYVGDDGLVYKHIADKMMPDEEIDDTKTKTGISSKLASQLTFSSFK